jgi:hypothetical protein
MLAEAYQRRQVPEPSGLWHEKVMQAIRAERGSPQVVRLRAEARIAWHGALATAAAAVLVAVAGLRVMPSDAQLAWEFQQDGVLSAWVLQTGESR